MTANEVNNGNNVFAESNSDDGMDFCRGMSMTMSMSGFQSAFFSRGPPDCITFLFTDWKLDRPGKFVGAMIFTFFLAVASEGMVHGQQYVRNRYLTQKPKSQRKAISTILYGFQQIVGWILMLISMIFSIELFASVVLGLFVGKLLFPAEELYEGRRNRPAPTMTSSDPREGTGHADDNAASDPLLQAELSAESSRTTDATSVRRRRR